MELFYYYALFFIFRCIRGFWFVSKDAKKQLDLMEEMNLRQTLRLPFDEEGNAKKREKIRRVNSKIKEKSLYKNITNALDLIWQVTGIFIGTYRPVFIILLCSNLASRILPMFMKTKSQFAAVIIIANIIELVSASYMVYLFINTQINLL